MANNMVYSDTINEDLKWNISKKGTKQVWIKHQILLCKKLYVWQVRSGRGKSKQKIWNSFASCLKAAVLLQFGTYMKLKLRTLSAWNLRPKWSKKDLCSCTSYFKFPLTSNYIQKQSRCCKSILSKWGLQR